MKSRLKSLLERLRAHRRLSAIVDVISDLVREWKADRVSSLGAEIAFWGVLAIFPALLAITATIGSLESITGSDFAEQARTTIIDWLDQLFGGNQAAIKPFVDILNNSNTGVAVVGLLGALYTTSRGFVAAIKSLTVAYDLPETRSWLRLRLMAFGLSVGAVIAYVLVLAVFILGPLLGLGDDLDGGWFNTFWSWFRGPFLVAVLVASATTLMHFAPNKRSPWRWDLPGALLSTLLWALAVVGFRVYVRFASTGNEVYGVIGGAITLMVFMYIMSLGLLVGGELNSILTRRYGPERRSLTLKEHYERAVDRYDELVEAASDWWSGDRNDEGGPDGDASGTGDEEPVDATDGGGGTDPGAGGNTASENPVSSPAADGSDASDSTPTRGGSVRPPGSG